MNAAGTSTPLSGRMVVFIASDGSTTAHVPIEHAHQSLLLRDMLDGNEDEEIPIPLGNVDAATLHLVASYLELRHGNPPTEIERPLREPLFSIVDEKDKRFIEALDEEAVLKLVTASNFLNHPALKSLSCARCADWMKDKTVEEIRDMFGLTCDFTPEETAILKKEHGLNDVM
jgi:S-phase kinase-associated protein 1